ncbi:MAG: hypothetical protein RMI79_02010, partial [Nitrososphaerota archaeon]|nr:hypothetical protein [Nitrososphaerota archaeon]
EGNFSIMRKILEDEINKFMERVYRTEDFLSKCGLKIYFEKPIIYYHSEEEYIIEIIIEVYVEDNEGSFSFKRDNRIIRSL